MEKWKVINLYKHWWVWFFFIIRTIAFLSLTLIYLPGNGQSTFHRLLLPNFSENDNPSRLPTACWYVLATGCGKERGGGGEGEPRSLMRSSTFRETEKEKGPGKGGTKRKKKSLLHFPGCCLYSCDNILIASFPGTCNSRLCLRFVLELVRSRLIWVFVRGSS